MLHLTKLYLAENKTNKHSLRQSDIPAEERSRECPEKVSWYWASVGILTIWVAGWLGGISLEVEWEKKTGWRCRRRAKLVHGIPAQGPGLTVMEVC